MIVATALVFPAAAIAATGAQGSSAVVAVQDAKVAKLATAEAPPARYQRLAHRLAIRIDEAEAKAAQRKRREAFADLPGGVSIATLESIASCESGGDPTAVSSEGTYRGKYQFDHGTWETVGGHGDPAAAPEYEQDYRAALLYSRSGSSPWPVCG